MRKIQNTESHHTYLQNYHQNYQERDKQNNRSKFGWRPIRVQKSINTREVIITLRILLEKQITGNKDTFIAFVDL